MFKDRCTVIVSCQEYTCSCAFHTGFVRIDHNYDIRSIPPRDGNQEMSMTVMVNQQTPYGRASIEHDYYFSFFCPKICSWCIKIKKVDLNAKNKPKIAQLFDIVCLHFKKMKCKWACCLDIHINKISYESTIFFKVTWNNGYTLLVNFTFDFDKLCGSWKFQILFAE